MSKRILYIFVVLALAWSSMADVQAKSKKKGRCSGQTAMQVASQMWPGWNLGNTMEGGTYDHEWTDKAGVDSEVSWQKTRTTRELFAFVRQQGFRSVRIPCAPPGTGDSSWDAVANRGSARGSAADRNSELSPSQELPQPPKLHPIQKIFFNHIIFLQKKEIPHGKPEIS